ncbi:hypothetical protein E2562_033895, partial [Oryza meyeriana var. granulata]
EQYGYLGIMVSSGKLGARAWGPMLTSIMVLGTMQFRKKTPRVLSISLSGKNLTGSIPVELTKLPGLVESRLDGNSFSGSIPDFTGCQDLQYIHLDNNQLTGALPSSLDVLPNLKQLYVQNNELSSEIPQELFRKSINF